MQIASDKSIVCEGRDITSVVFPDAKYKIYLTASLKVRAKRRFAQEVAKGEPVTLAQVTKGIADRDYLDMTRAVSPLIHVKGAKLIDSSKLDAMQTVQQFIEYFESKKKQDEKINNFKKPFGANVIRKFLKITFSPFYRMFYMVQVKNKQELKKHRGKPVIFAVNHRSNADVPTLFCTFRNRKLNFIGKAGLFKPNTAFNWFLRSLNGVPIVPGKNDLAIIRHSLKILKDGETLLIFPEGRRVFAGDDGAALRNGTAMIAMKSGVPVVPIVTNRAPRPFRFNKLKIGKTIYPTDFTDKTEFSNALRDEMSGLLDGFEVRKKRDREPVVNTRAITFIDKKLVLIKRIRNGETYYSFPGGTVEDDENPRDCAPREIKEETNIDASATRLLYKYRMVKPLHQAGQMQGFYLCEYKGGQVGPTDAAEFKRDPEAISPVTGMKNGIFEPILIDMDELGELDVRPNIVRDQLVNDIDKYGIQLTRRTKYLK